MASDAKTGKRFDVGQPKRSAAELAQKRVLGTRQAAAFVCLSVPEWERRRAAGETPPAVQLGTRKLGYTIESLIAWIKARQQPTAA
jgi:predicted DNA-binding transcriptional regulator AlpA